MNFIPINQIQMNQQLNQSLTLVQKKMQNFFGHFYKHSLHNQKVIPIIQANSSIDSDNDSFERLEDKYLLTIEQYQRLLAQVQKHMPRDRFQRDVNYTTIESIYLDTKNFDFFTHHILGEEKRQKMRIRRYHENQNNHYLLEIKRKDCGLTKKIRFLISYDFGQKILKGYWPSWEAIEEELSKINENNISHKKLHKRYLHAQSVFVENKLIPNLKIRYNRSAFEENDFRVTFDSDLTAETLVGMKNIKDFSLNHHDVLRKSMLFLLKDVQRDKKIIMEIKHHNNIPCWLNEQLVDMNITKVSFSKYCHFISKFAHQENYFDYLNHLNNFDHLDKFGLL